MGEKTKISWTDHTFNPWIGCKKVSEGCAHCYAAAQDRMRFSKTLGGATKDNPVSHWGKGAPRYRTSADYWKEPVKWNREAAETVARIKADIGNTSEYQSVDYERPRVFCASLADWLDDEVPAEWLADLLELIHATPNLDWLLLTKRPENWWTRLMRARDTLPLGDPTALAIGFWLTETTMQTPPKNIWIGTTCENQSRAEDRIPHLLNIPARVRFLSCEPLLGPVNLEAMPLNPEDRMFLYWPLTGAHLCDGYNEPRTLNGSQRLHWIIAGGESGPGHRAMNLDWLTSLASQCEAAGVPFFCKQDNGSRSGMQGRIPDQLWCRKEFPEA